MQAITFKWSVEVQHAAGRQYAVRPVEERFTAAPWGNVNHVNCHNSRNGGLPGVQFYGPGLLQDVQQERFRKVGAGLGVQPAVDAFKGAGVTVAGLPYPGCERRGDEYGMLSGTAGNFKDGARGRQVVLQHLQYEWAIAFSCGRRIQCHQSTLWGCTVSLGPPLSSAGGV